MVQPLFSNRDTMRITWKPVVSNVTLVANLWAVVNIPTDIFFQEQGQGP